MPHVCTHLKIRHQAQEACISTSYRVRSSIMILLSVEYIRPLSALSRPSGPSQVLWLESEGLEDGHPLLVHDNKSLGLEQRFEAPVRARTALVSISRKSLFETVTCQAL